MAADFKFEVTQEAILDFLKERGGKVKNTDLIEHFQAVFPEEVEERAAARSAFKNHVDGVAFVKAESGVKYVCLRKKFRGSGPDQASGREEHTCRQASAHEPAQPPGGEASQRTPPGSGYGSGSQVGVPHVFSPGAALPDDKSKCLVAEKAESNSGKMGSGQSVRRASRQSGMERFRSGPDVPEITVIEASPLPATGDVFALSAPAQTEALSPEGLKGVEQINVVIRRQSSKGSQHRSRRLLSDDGEDAPSLSGSDGNASPKGSRMHFLEAMMNSSPQLRRSVALRSSVCLSARGADGDSVSLASSALDEDRAAIALDPLEHEWMMCSSDGEWASLRRLLAAEPSLVLRKDFITGFTCLHWAAKHGKPELLALLINFARRCGVPLSVDARSGSGYTPLHVAAMQNHVEVVKLLVGAYNADVEIRDYSGRKACQYLTGNVGSDIQDIIGASDPGENAEHGGSGRSRLSKVLQSNLRPLRLPSPDDSVSADGEVRPREKPVRRKSSFSRMKPKLEKLRWRTSQIVHSTSFRDGEELEGSLKGSFKSRPKTHFFG